MAVFRLIRIFSIILYYGIDQLVFRRFALSRLCFIRLNKDNRAKRLSKALIKLGPLFIKFGQILSTRRDLLAPDIAHELSKLQDNVAPYGFEIVLKQIEKVYRCPPQHIFSHIEKEPLGSASIAQVHGGQLLNGEPIVIKLLRPNIKKKVKRDINLLYLLAKCFMILQPHLKRLHPIAVVNEIKHTLDLELDLSNEAANGSQLRKNFQISTKLYVPKMHWDLVRNDIIVMERIYGIPIKHIEQMKAQNVNLEKLARFGTEIFLQQVFEDNFFHADMHPGNLFVNVSDPNHPVYEGVDFGICATLSPSDQKYIALNLVAFFQQDYMKIAQLHIDSGWVPHHTDAHKFAAHIRNVCEPIINRPLKEISFGRLMDGLIRTARSFKMEVQPQLLLLQKTIFNIEGLGRDLYPDLNLWDQAKPFLENWVKKQNHPIKKLEQLNRLLENQYKDNQPAHKTQPPHRPNHTLKKISILTIFIGGFSLYYTEFFNPWIGGIMVIQLIGLWLT